MIQSILTNGYYAIVILLIFGLAVFVHEFGHMMFAIIRGVGVESFAIGMGPKICAWYWGGIEFSLRWFPVGGFVKLKGMVAEEADAAAENHENTNPGHGLATIGDVDVDRGKEGSKKSVSEASYDDLLALSNQGLLTKLLVFGGGVFMNYVTAIVAMGLLLMLPKQIPQIEAIVHSIEAPAGQTAIPLQPGDQLVGINGRAFTYMHQMEEAIAQTYEAAAQAEKTDAAEVATDVHLTVQRAGQPVDVALGKLTPEQLHAELLTIEYRLPAVIEMVTPTQPADKAGIKAGDRITALNGQPITSFNEIVDIVNASLAKPVQVQVVRKGEGGAEQTLDFSVTPVPHIDKPENGMIGIQPGAETDYTEPGMGLGQALLQAWPRTNAHLGYLVEKHIEFFSRATLTQIKDNMGGPIMIAGMTKRFAERGLPDLVFWFITLNLMLMVFNLLPLPVLDGGFIVLSVIEAVIRRPVPPKVLAPIYTGFVVLFITLMVVISVLDVRRWLF